MSVEPVRLAIRRDARGRGRLVLVERPRIASPGSTRSAALVAAGTGAAVQPGTGSMTDRAARPATPTFRLRPGDLPYIGRALNHERPRHRHDRIDAATFAVAYDRLVARGETDRSTLTRLVEAMEAASGLERAMAAGGEIVLADWTAEGMHSVTYRPCPLGPNPNRPGLVAAAAFVDASLVSEPCPRCGHCHRRDV